MTQIEFDREMARLSILRAEEINKAERAYNEARGKAIQLMQDADKALRERLASAETTREELQKELDTVVIETGNKDCPRGVQAMAQIRQQKLLISNINREIGALKRNHRTTLDELTQDYHYLCREANLSYSKAKIDLETDKDSIVFHVKESV
ncbi:MAG: hypothetical protein IKR17_05935 [Bacteroidales bacterium]|nr:hypothetical protein [Bacteroidales bacterium]